jgi:predicted nucleic acid-binding protein
VKILLDTNVTLRASVETASEHPLVSQALLHLVAQGHELSLAPQTLYEFWAVATRPLAVNGFAHSPQETRRRIDDLLTAYELLPDPPDLVTRWADLCDRYQVAGKQAHDARLVALMLSHGVTHLLTLNPRDFTRYSEITVIKPQDV